MSPGPSLIVAIALSASLLFAGSAGAQVSTPGEVDSGKVQPLNLKAGCWEVRTVISTDVKNGALAPSMPKAPTSDEALRQILAALTPEQRAAFDAATWKKNYEASMAQQAQAFKQQAQIMADAMKKGSVNTVPICTPTPFIDQGKQLYGSLPQGCTRTVRPAGAALHASLTCPNRTIDNDFEPFLDFFVEPKSD